MAQKDGGGEEATPAIALFLSLTHSLFFLDFRPSSPRRVAALAGRPSGSVRIQRVVATCSALSAPPPYLLGQPNVRRQKCKRRRKVY